MQKGLALDPDIDWLKASWRIENNWRLALVAGVPDRQFWTTIEDRLQQLGEDGWELIGTTPPSYFHHDSQATESEFHLLLKRPLFESTAGEEAL